MIGARLHRARKAAGLSLRDLGQNIGVSHTAVSKYEKDQLMPASGQLIKLSKALGVRAEYFLRPISVEIEGWGYCWTCRTKFIEVLSQWNFCIM